MIGANLELVAQERREFRLREAIEPIRHNYPFIVLDCPPALDLLTLNALVAADGLLVPMQAEYFALEGISRTDADAGPGRAGVQSVAGARRRAADHVRRPHQPVAAGDGELAGVLRRKSCWRRRFRATSGWRRRPATASRLEYDPRSRGAESYIRLAKEIIERQPSAVCSQPPGDFAGESTEQHREEPAPEAALEEVPSPVEEMDKTA